MGRFLVLAFVAALAGYASGAGRTYCVSVATKAPHNAEAKFWCHVPDGYDAKRTKPYPVLVYFGGRNCSGEREASGLLGWADWADERGVFIVAPGLKDDDYWNPEEWSGKALLGALAEIRREYRIDDAKLLYYGYSAGSQAANLFPAWRPGRTRAWASHACGVFHAPKAAMRGIPGLVTCGDADAARYMISRDFVARARRRGVDVIWKSFPNHPHDVPPDSLALTRAFFAACLEGRFSGKAAGSFVGDDQDAVYYPAESAEAEFIDPADRVRLPTAAIASAWGKPGVKAAVVEKPDEIVRFVKGGVEFVCRVPSGYDADSRVIVLFGGRGWPGDKTLSAFAFGRLADRERAFMVSPSFSKGEYWRPETGTGRKLAAAIAEVRTRYGLKNLPIVLYGYSAGGQCAALFAQADGLSVAAWGAHGCGVFPDAPCGTSAAVLVTCGEGDEERMRICRHLACRYRENGGKLLFKPLPGGHELGDRALAIAREWIRAVVCGGESWIWGEDDTYRVVDRDAIEVEFRNPLYTDRLADLWRQ